MQGSALPQAGLVLGCLAMASEVYVLGLGIRGCLLDLVALFVHLESNLNHQQACLVLQKDLPPEERSGMGI